MSFAEILNRVLLMPLQLIFETIYMLANRVIQNPGLSIIVLSLLMNFLVLPLYKRADAMQEEEKEMEMKLRDGVAHIKKTFKGDERMMMLQTYYRQNHYKPTYVLRSAVSLFLEIPFFMAAYHFLSELTLLNGVSFGPIADLAKPDGLLVLGGITINVLPILMTSINLISCVIFTKGSSTKQKIQLYGMALFFLVFLYTSPSGLVFYWTLNNLFSLVKTIFYKIKNPGKVLSILFSVVGWAVVIYGKFFYPVRTARRVGFIVLCGLALQLPGIYLVVKKKYLDKREHRLAEPSRSLYFAGGAFMTVLTGILIPSAVINASPQEFLDINHYYHPLWFIACTLTVAAGLFIVWAGVFYWLAKPSGKVLFEKGIWAMSGIAIINYMFFGKNLGILNPELKYEGGIDFLDSEEINNAVILFIILIILLFVVSRWKKQATSFLVIATLAMGGMGIANMISINQSIGETTAQLSDAQKMPEINLSKKGKNVVVLMLDRAIGAYVPYLFNEKPVLKEQFAGFTYYPNTISFGGYTNAGTPALFGGYEYVPMEINKRSEENLVDKQNESLKVMPLLFRDNKFEVTVCDPTYANYQWIPDLSIYDEYPDIKTYISTGKFSKQESKEVRVMNNKRRFFCYSIMKTAPLGLQELLYDRGHYNQSHYGSAEEGVYLGQTVKSPTVADGIFSQFMNCYDVLENMDTMTKVNGTKENTFLLMTNDTTHEPMMLQLPDYVPAEHVDNTKYVQEQQKSLTVNGVTLQLDNADQVIHYHANMAALLKLGEWFDYLRENEVYDNTRIILVADHGRPLYHANEFLLEDGNDRCFFNPLLMVKDFDAKEFQVSEEFMTNGDVPTLAMEQLIDHPINPFTGKLIDSSEKTAHDQYIMLSHDWDTRVNNGKQFLPGRWYSVKEDMRDNKNWTLLEESAVLQSK